MNRRQLLSLAVIPFIPKALEATAPADKTLIDQLYISGYGKQEICKVTGKKGLRFKVSESTRKAESDLFKLLCKIFPNSSYGDLRVDYLKLSNSEVMKEYGTFIEGAKFYVCYMTASKTLSMLTFGPGTALLSRYNKNGIRIN